MSRARSQRPSSLFLAAAAAAIAVCSSACASTIRIEVRFDEKTNDGRAFYVAVRTVDGQALLSEDYDDAASRIFVSPRDPSVQKIQALLPGGSADITLPMPEESDLAVYFFFSRPGAKWWVPLIRPLPADVLIQLGTNEISRVLVRKR